MRIIKWSVVIAVLFAVFGLSGCKEEPPKQKAWNDFCRRVDCKQFPLWYQTFELNGEYFYFPMELRSPLRYLRTIPWGGFRELIKINDRWQILRRVELGRKKLKIYPGAAALIKYFNLDWPKNISTMTSFEMYVIEEHPSLGWKYTRTFDLDDNNYKSADKNFYITDIGKISKSNEYRSFSILSKKPLLNGWHVIGDCFISCEFYTVKIKGQKPSKRHSIYMDQLLITSFGRPQIPGYRPVECDSENPLLDCDKGFAELLSGLPIIFKTIEKLIARLKIKPGVVTGELK